MKNKLNYIIVLAFIIGCYNNLFAQYDSISKSERFYSLQKKAIIPATLIGTSLLLTHSKFEMQLRDEVQKGFNNDFNTKLDDYFRFVPLAQMYVADIAGVESRSHWFDQTKNATISLLLTDLVTTRLKRMTNKTRPSGENNHAFPSAHTAYAFTSATVLYEEFKDTKPLLAYSGYAFALTTGYLRMAEDAHWFSDVVLGAGIGIAITKLVYHFDYLFAWNPFKKKDTFFVSPMYDGNAFGVSSVIRF